MKFINSLNWVLLHRVFIVLYIIFYPILFSFTYMTGVIYILLCCFLIISIVTALHYNTNHEIIYFGINLKPLKTLKHSYWYVIDDKTQYIKIYKQELFWFHEHDYMYIYNHTTTTDIDSFLLKNITKINNNSNNNAKYLAEEMSYWKQK